MPMPKSPTWLISIQLTNGASYNTKIKRKYLKEKDLEVVCRHLLKTVSFRLAPRGKVLIGAKEPYFEALIFVTLHEPGEI